MATESLSTEVTEKRVLNEVHRRAKEIRGGIQKCPGFCTACDKVQAKRGDLKAAALNIEARTWETKLFLVPSLRDSK